MVQMAVLAALMAAVQVTECGKCDKRFRISDDGETATVNVARLKDDAPDAETLAQRTAAMKRHVHLLGGNIRSAGGAGETPPPQATVAMSNFILTLNFGQHQHQISFEGEQDLRSMV